MRQFIGDYSLITFGKEQVITHLYNDLVNSGIRRRKNYKGLDLITERVVIKVSGYTNYRYSLDLIVDRLTSLPNLTNHEGILVLFNNTYPSPIYWKDKQKVFKDCINKSVRLYWYAYRRSLSEFLKDKHLVKVT